MTYFPYFNAGVRVFEDGGEAIGIEGCGEGGLLLVGCCPDFDCVGEGEFLEDEGYFPGIWPGCRGVRMC